LAKRPIIIARELTKAHEEWLNGSDDVPERGEFVVIFGQITEYDGSTMHFDDAQIAVLFGQITESAAFDSRRAVIKAVATELGLSVRSVYDALERAKKQPA
jgi:16S rRNA C1402 (ribose-2'-O) methylase RsmI